MRYWKSGKADVEKTRERKIVRKKERKANHCA